MIFGAPTYLWTFLGLLLPIAIHLWNRRKLKVIKIGSTKLLEALPYRHTSSLHVNEWALLILRLLILGLLALILSEPAIKKKAVKSPITYIVEPSLAGNDDVKAILDTIAHGEIRLLLKDFPKIRSIEELGNGDATPNYWQLAKEMEAVATDSIVVISKGTVKGIKGMRPLVSANINWIVLDPTEPVVGQIEARMYRDSVTIISAKGSQSQLSFGKETLPMNDQSLQLNASGDSIRINKGSRITNLPLKLDSPLKVLIMYSDSLDRERIYMKSAYKALSKFLRRDIVLQEVKQMEVNDTTGLHSLIWLSQETVPQVSIPLLAYRPDEIANGMIIKGDGRMVYHLTEPLNSENILDKRLMESLYEMLDLHPGLAGSIGPFDIRGMAKAELEPRMDRKEEHQTSYMMIALSSYLWPFLIGFLIGERILAQYRRQ